MKIQDIETREEMYLLVPDNGIGAEIGVCKGINSMSLYLATRPKLMYLVDIWTDETPDKVEWPKGNMPALWYANHYDLVNKFFHSEISENKVKTIRGFGSDFLSGLKDNSLDWVYLDSNHNYDCVSIELELSVKKVKPGGYIMGHDYYCNVTDFGTSIIRAVNEQVQNSSIRMVGITKELWSSYICEVL